MIKILLILLLLISPCYAQESSYDVIPEFDEDSKVILNEQLRRTTRRLRDLEGGTHDLDSDTTGILPFSKGGTNTNITATADTMLYINSIGKMNHTGASTRVGTTFLRDDFTFAAVTLSNPGLTLISVTSMSASSNSGDISISPSKLYKVIIDGIPPGTASPIVRFNSLSTGIYDWVSYGYTMAASPSLVSSGGTNATSINLSSGTVDQDQVISIEFEMSTFKNAAFSARIMGTGVYRNDAGNSILDSFGGFIESDITIADFEVDMDTNFTGKIYLYEYDIAL